MISVNPSPSTRLLQMGETIDLNGVMFLEFDYPDEGVTIQASGP
jgi:hypothetical protein